MTMVRMRRVAGGRGDRALLKFVGGFFRFAGGVLPTPLHVKLEIATALVMWRSLYLFKVCGISRD
jgi:hypothetical protein